LISITRTWSPLYERRKNTSSMETAQFLTLAGLSVVSIGLCIYVLSKIRTVTYLLEQPVVKKMSPQLKLKPVKIDELDESRAAAPARSPANGVPQNRGPRPGAEAERGRENRDSVNGNRDRAPRADRPVDRPETEGRREGGDRADRAPRNDRPDRGERFGGREGGREGGRDRGGRPDRHERGDRGDRFGNREGGRERTREGFGGEREAAAAPAAPANPETAPVASIAPALAPRRPLPSTVDQENTNVNAAPLDISAPNASAEDALFTRDDSDIQHGRRHQPKKKPRFDLKEEEVKEETKAL
jgi:hypothetical protein